MPGSHRVTQLAGAVFHPSLAACGQSHAAQFSRWGLGRRCIPAEPRRFASLIVAFRSKYTRYSSLTRLVSRAPRRPRRSRHFIHRLLTAGGETHAAQFSRWGLDRRCIPSGPLRFAPFFVAFQSKYTRASSPGGGSSFMRLVRRAPTRRTGPTGRTGPRQPRRSRGFHHRLLRRPLSRQSTFPAVPFLRRIPECLKQS